LLLSASAADGERPAIAEEPLVHFDIWQALLDLWRGLLSNSETSAADVLTKLAPAPAEWGPDFSFTARVEPTILQTRASLRHSLMRVLLRIQAIVV
jgi:hypothetical protein